jgi:hypothetical protein
MSGCRHRQCLHSNIPRPPAQSREYQSAVQFAQTVGLTSGRSGQVRSGADHMLRCFEGAYCPHLQGLDEWETTKEDQTTRRHVTEAVTVVITSISQTNKYSHSIRHYATRRKIAGSIPDEVNEFFSLLNPSGVHSASNRNEYQKQKNNVYG